MQTIKSTTCFLISRFETELFHDTIFCVVTKKRIINAPYLLLIECTTLLIEPCFTPNEIELLQCVNTFRGLNAFKLYGNVLFTNYLKCR